MEKRFIGVISDTHISDRGESLPRKVFELFDGACAIFHLGDMTSLLVLEDLRAVTEVYAVAGNMDIFPVDETLPNERTVELFGRRFALTHGWGPRSGLAERVKNKFSGNNIDCLVFGHSHCAYSETVEGLLLFNPGSCSRSAGPDRSVGIIEVDEGGLSTKVIII